MLGRSNLPLVEGRLAVESRTLSPTLEDYLEAISRLVAEKGAARARDIASAMSVHKSTVTSALKGLAEKGVVNYHPYEVVTITPEGQKAAREIASRHRVIGRFLSEVLSLDEEVAEANACRMEHVVDGEVLERLALFAQFVRECPRAGEDWLERFREFYERGGAPPGDEAAAKDWLAGFRRRLRERREGGPER